MTFRTIKINTKVLKKWASRHSSAVMAIHDYDDEIRIMFYNTNAKGDLEKGNVDPLYYLIDKESTNEKK